MKKFALLAAIIAAVVFAFAACACEADVPYDEEVPHGELPSGELTLERMVRAGTVVATANGINITAGDLAFMLAEAEMSLQFDFMREVAEEDWDQTVLEDAVKLTALLLIIEDYALRNNITVPQEELDMIATNIQDMIEFYGDELDEFLASNNIFGREHMDRYFEVFPIMYAAVNAIMESPELFADFEEYLIPDEMEIFGAKHILIRFDDFDSEEEATDFAWEVRERAVAGEDFDSLIIAYCNDPGMTMALLRDQFIIPDAEWEFIMEIHARRADGEDFFDIIAERGLDPELLNNQGYTFTPGAMVEEFEQGTRELEIGEISEPIETVHGIHIILRIPPSDDPNDIQGPRPLSLEERMFQAIFASFESQVEAVDIVFLPALYEIQLRTDEE